MGIDHRMSTETFRLTLALSVTAHLLVFAWNAPSLTLPGRVDAILSVTLDGNGPETVTADARANAKRSRTVKPDDDHIVQAPLASGTSSMPTENPVREIRQPGPDDGQDQAQTRAYLRSRLLTNLAEYFHYPAVARRHGWEGTVWLGLRVEPDGHLEGIRLERSSGYAVLDDSALNSLQRIGHLVEARAWLGGRSMELQLPVIYRLIEN